VLGGVTVKQLIELSGQHLSIRAIARRLDISRNTVRKYLRSPGLPVAKPRPRRPSKVDPFRDHVRRRLAAGVENCVILLRELRAQGYAGSYSILKDHVRPLRLGRAVKATMRFETQPREQAQVDFGHFPFLTLDGQPHWYWGFVMVLAWSRLLYVEFIRRADVASFVRCHLNAFEYFGGLPRTCLYDNTKVVVLGRNAAGVPHWNATFLDFALRFGFEARLCQPYRAQTKGRVESGVKYVKHNFWPAVEFVDGVDLNRQAHVWMDTVANVRVHGTTGERPVDRFGREARTCSHCRPPSASNTLPARGTSGRPRRLRRVGARLVLRAVAVGRPAGTGRRHRDPGGALGRQYTAGRAPSGDASRAAARAAWAMGRSAARRCAPPSRPARTAARGPRSRGTAAGDL